MGVSGCGKSTLGVMLAQALGADFLEGDDFHSTDAIEKMRSGRALTDEDRWPWLDRLGQAVATIVTAPATPPRPVVAACSALRKSYRDRLRAAAGTAVCFVLLESDRDKLLARMASRSGHFMPSSLLDSQLAALEMPAPEEEALVLSADLSPELLCAQVLAWLA